jgi:hypothetical protein
VVAPSLLFLAAAATGPARAAPHTINAAAAQPRPPNQRYLQVATVWEDGTGGSGPISAASGTIVDEIAASLCHVRRRQAGLRGVFARPAAAGQQQQQQKQPQHVVVAYCAPDGVAAGEDNESVEAAAAAIRELRRRCQSAFYRGQLASEVAARTHAALRLVKVACRVCETDSMGKRGTGCL